jgi:hypothetical protein
MGTLVSRTAPLREYWRQLDPPYRKVTAWVVVFLVLVVTLSVLAALSPSKGQSPREEAVATTTTKPRIATPVAVQFVTVTVVMDGRTVIGSDGEQVVVEGLGQPGQCWAEAAVDFAKITLLGKRVRVDGDIVRLPDGDDFAVLMASRGLGRVKAGARTAISEAQQMAKSAKLGLWGEPCRGSDGSPPSGAATAHNEAEASPAVCSGTIDTNWGGYSGSGFCNVDNAVGAFAQFTVTSSAVGSATVVVRFANGDQAGRAADVLVNGTKVQSVLFEATGAWSTWASKTLTIALPSGGNTIRLAATAADGLPNIDYIDDTI